MLGLPLESLCYSLLLKIKTMRLKDKMFVRRYYTQKKVFFIGCSDPVYWVRVGWESSQCQDKMAFIFVIEFRKCESFLKC